MIWVSNPCLRLLSQQQQQKQQRRSSNSNSNSNSNNKSITNIPGACNIHPPALFPGTEQRQRQKGGLIAANLPHAVADLCLHRGYLMIPQNLPSVTPSTPDLEASLPRAHAKTSRCNTCRRCTKKKGATWESTGVCTNDFTVDFFFTSPLLTHPSSLLLAPSPSSLVQPLSKLWAPSSAAF